MKTIDAIHGDYVFSRRVRYLSGEIAPLLPEGARVLDVGCGDGLIAKRITEARPDLDLRGVDVLVRGHTHIPIEEFDGTSLPYDDGSYDVVMFVDVLHHTDDPNVLLREASRVASRAVVIKDHLREGLLAGPTLRFMDHVGNARHGVVLPYNYWPRRRWEEAFDRLGLVPEVWRDSLHLYPWWANWVFGRSLHFITKLVHRGA